LCWLTQRELDMKAAIRKTRKTQVSSSPPPTEVISAVSLKCYKLKKKVGLMRRKASTLAQEKRVSWPETDRTSKASEKCY
jgi:hypothetical protein